MMVLGGFCVKVPVAYTLKVWDFAPNEGDDVVPTEWVL